MLVFRHTSVHHLIKLVSVIRYACDLSTVNRKKSDANEVTAV